MSKFDLDKFGVKVHNQKVENKRFFSRIKKKTPKSIHGEINALHNTVFDQIDCLDCANCCKTTPPIITNKDITRISSHLKMKEGDFMEKYVLTDSEGDYIFKMTPCEFLDSENYCLIYDMRPKACREYPHTDINRVSLKLMEKNINVCPAVFEMLQGIKKL